MSGSVNILMPEGDIFNEDQALRNKQLMDKLEQIMESWTQKIAQTIKKEEAKKAEPNSSIAEIEYWRARNAVISTLYQQLNNGVISQVKKLLVAHLSESNMQVVNEFDSQMKELTRLCGEAKDNVKFLTTLERQFKNLASNEGLTIIEETLPSLMNGLRLVWIISRHFKEEEQMQNLLQTISNEIANKVEKFV